MGPEALLAEGVAGQDLGARTQGPVGIEHARGEALEEESLLARDAEVAQAALGMGESEGEGAGGRARVVVPLREGEGRLPRGRHSRGEGEPHEPARRETNALPQADHGVEHDSGGAGERASIEGLGILGAASAAQETAAIGLPLHRPLRPAFEAQDVDGPGGGLVRPPRPPMAEEGGALGQVLGLDEQLAEGGVGQIVGRGGEDDLRIARDLDLPGTVAVVGHGQPAHLDVVFGRDRDVELGGDVVVAPVEGRLLREEGHEVVLRLLQGGLEGGRPHGTAPHVAQVEELASGVASRILPMPRHHPAPAEAGAPSRVRHHGGVVAVGQELGMGKPACGASGSGEWRGPAPARSCVSPPPAAAGRSGLGAGPAPAGGAPWPAPAGRRGIASPSDRPSGHWRERPGSFPGDGP